MPAGFPMSETELEKVADIFFPKREALLLVDKIVEKLMNGDDAKGEVSILLV